MNIEIIRDLELNPYIKYNSVKTKSVPVSDWDRKILGFLYARCKNGKWAQNHDFDFIKYVHQESHATQQEFDSYIALNALNAGRMDIFNKINISGMDHINLWLAAVKGGNLKCIKHIARVIKSKADSKFMEDLQHNNNFLIKRCIESNDTIKIKYIVQYSSVNKDRIQDLYNFTGFQNTTVDTIKCVERLLDCKLDICRIALVNNNLNLLRHGLLRMQRTEIFDLLIECELSWFQGWNAIYKHLNNPKYMFDAKLSQEEKQEIHDMLIHHQQLRNDSAKYCKNLLLVYNAFSSTYSDFSEDTVNCILRVINKLNLFRCSWTYVIQLRNLFEILRSKRPEDDTVNTFFNTYIQVWDKICNTLPCGSGSKYGVMPMVLDMLSSDFD